MITSDENTDENEYSHWVNSVAAGKKSMDAKCMILLKDEKIVF